MKVSIKHLSITFMGNEETKATAAPTEFYSPYERELRAKLEAAESERNSLTAALLQAYKDRFADKLKPDDAGNIIADRLGGALEAKQNECGLLKAELREMTKAGIDLRSELNQINGWVKEYDEGAWPDHNAKGVGPVAIEVLHMMRDLWADLESRPLPAKLDKGEYWVTARNINEQVTQYGDCLFVAFNEDGKPLGAWHSKADAVSRAANYNASAKPAPAQPVPTLDPVGVGQPAPETPDTQPAAPESVMPGPATGTQAPTAKICPGGGCMNFLDIGQKYCGDKSCKRSQEVIEAVAMQAVPIDESEALVELHSVCQHEGCDEPSRPNVGSSYCFQHRPRRPTRNNV